MKPNVLRSIRIIIATFTFVAITILLLDFTGFSLPWLGWLAEIQFMPAILSLNLGIVLGLLLLTFLLGRVYCSVICPLGILQDLLARVCSKKRYSYSPARSVLRNIVLFLFIASLLCGIGSFVALLSPYSSYGRIVTSLLSPIYRWCNNLFAVMAESFDSYVFYETSIWVRSVPTLVISAVTLLLLFILVRVGGRTYCNTICPVGTLLGHVARFSWFRPVIDREKCSKCGLCSRRCKASCIDTTNGEIDLSRCVACMDCLSNCTKGAISYSHPVARAKDSIGGTCHSESKMVQTNSTLPEHKESDNNLSRRAFLGVSGAMVSHIALQAQDKIVDGGLAIIEDKCIPDRKTSILPPGAWSARHFAKHCTGCNLCVTACPNDVLRPSASLLTLMQPEVSFERGYCRPECNRCSQVCPTDAIRPISLEERSSVSVGHAVWIKENCVVLTDGVACGNCARHCPTGAIVMVPIDEKDKKSHKIPTIDQERCIGCGACENLCPSRPFSAIYVEGHEQHREI